MSYRQSLYPPPNNDNSQALQQLVDKQRQVELYHNILNHSQTLLDNYTRLYENYNLLVGGSEAVGDVVEHWQNIFRSTSLALGSIHSQKQALASSSSSSIDEQNGDNLQLPKTTKPDQLVRLPVLEQQQQQQPQPALMSE